MFYNEKVTEQTVIFKYSSSWDFLFTYLKRLPKSCWQMLHMVYGCVGRMLNALPSFNHNIIEYWIYEEKCLKSLILPFTIKITSTWLLQPTLPQSNALRWKDKISLAIGVPVAKLGIFRYNELVTCLRITQPIKT